MIEVGEGGGARSLEICEVLRIADAIRGKGVTIKGGLGGFCPENFEI